MRKLLLVLLALLVIVAAAAAIYWQHGNAVMRAPGPHAETLLLDVPAGATVRSVLAELETRGALADRRAIELQLRVRGSPQIKTGKYEIPAHASPEQILQQLAEGRVLLESLTVVEGWTFVDMRRVVEAHPGIRSTLRGLDTAEFMSAIGHAGENPEGRFFPDTYRFAAGTMDRELFSLAYRKMFEALDAAWARRASGLPLAEIAMRPLTPAPPSWREGNRPASERPRIAGVALRYAPAAKHAPADRPDGDLRMGRGLRRQHPQARPADRHSIQHLYARAGLPTPIALPSREAIDAVVRPLETGDIFFVATGLETDRTCSRRHSRSTMPRSHAICTAKRQQGPDDAGPLHYARKESKARARRRQPIESQSLRARGVSRCTRRESRYRHQGGRTDSRAGAGSR
jgi:UPF0755 protein